MSNLIEELENKASEPDFWNDQEGSQATLKHLKVLRTWRRSWRRSS